MSFPGNLFPPPHNDFGVRTELLVLLTPHVAGDEYQAQQA